MEFNLAFVIFCVILSINNVVGSNDCKDIITEDDPLKVVDQEGNMVMTVSDCKTVVSDYLFLCSESLVKHQCCKSCSRKGLDMSCVDKLSKIVLSEGAEPLSCPEFVSQYPCYCRERKVRTMCCSSCREQGDLSFCDCQDHLSSPREIEVAPEHKVVISSCQELVDKFSYLCYHGYGGHRSLCCKSCTGICVDSPIYTTSFRMRHDDKASRQRCKDCTCAQIRSHGPEAISIACSLARIRKACCDMCSNA